jgi:hypothetical protein
MVKEKILIGLIICLILLTGCIKSVNEITANDDYIDKTVTVKGEVKAPLKIGKLSGYTLIDTNGDKIIISSQKLPQENEKVTVKGTLKKGLLGVGFYIETNN